MQKDANLVELDKCCRTHIFLQNFVLIQPRTSLPKICKIFEKQFANFASMRLPERYLLRPMTHVRGRRQSLKHGDDAVEVDAVRERRLAKFRQNVARFRLYRLRFLQENMRFAAFFKIYQILKLKFLKFDKFCRCCCICNNFAEFLRKLPIFQTDFLLKSSDCSGAKGCKSCGA